MLEHTDRRRLHTVVYCQCFSPCHKYLVTGDNFGYISIFNLSSALSPEATASSLNPFYTFKSSLQSIYSLYSYEQFLIAGGSGAIIAWPWIDILKKNSKEVWKLELQPVCKQFDSPEVNDIAISNKHDNCKLYAACGDNIARVYDIESGSLLTNFTGHSDYLHKIALRSNQSDCATASEDGSVRLWDIRAAQESVQIIEPYKNQECCRKEFGQWLGCLALDNDDWLVCGGGPYLSLWRLRSLSFTTIFETPNACQHDVQFYQDSIFSAGTESYLNKWTINGKLVSKMPTTPTCIYNIAINTEAEKTKILSIAGNTHKIDICTNFNYRALSLNVC